MVGPGRNDPGTRVPAPPTLQELADFDQSFAARDLENDDSGQTVEATWGKEYFQPVQFHGVDVGPFAGRTIVRPGETIGRAIARLHEELREAAETISNRKQASYLDSMTNLRDQVDGRR
jgi:hypothetical protein